MSIYAQFLSAQRHSVDQLTELYPEQKEAELLLKGTKFHLLYWLLWSWSYLWRHLLFLRETPLGSSIIRWTSSFLTWRPYSLHLEYIHLYPCSCPEDSNWSHMKPKASCRLPYCFLLERPLDLRIRLSLLSLITWPCLLSSSTISAYHCPVQSKIQWADPHWGAASGNSRHMAQKEWKKKSIAR